MAWTAASEIMVFRPPIRISWRAARAPAYGGVDGNEYIDLMCSYGPVLVGQHHPVIDEAAARQTREADVQTTPSARMVELAEAFMACAFGRGYGRP